MFLVSFNRAADNRIFAVPRKRATGGICHSGCRFATHGKFLFKDSVVLGLIGLEIPATEIVRSLNVWQSRKVCFGGTLPPMYVCVAQDA